MKAQIQLGENVAVVAIVIIILVIGITFWSRLQQSDTSGITRDQEARSIIEIGKSLSELPELKCYQTESDSDVNCFDYYKLLSMNQTIHDNANASKYYLDYFGNSKVTFQLLYPWPETNITVYDYNSSNMTTLRVSIPVVIEKDLGNNAVKGFGLLLVEGYYR